MKKLLFCIFAFASVLVPAQARRVDPGLWESAITRHDPEVAAPRALSEKARAAMRAQGLDMDGATIKAKVCITKEIMDSDKLPMLQSMKNCKVLKSSFAGSTMISDTECTMMGITSHSHSEITYESPRHYYGVIVSDTVRQGKTHHTSIEIDGRFVSSDCGAVRAILH